MAQYAALWSIAGRTGTRNEKPTITDPAVTEVIVTSERVKTDVPSKVLRTVATDNAKESASKELAEIEVMGGVMMVTTLLYVRY